MPSAKAREAYSLLVTRSWVVLAMSVVSWLLTCLVTLPRWGQLSGAERLCILIAGLFIGLSVALARIPKALWLTAVAMLLLAATALVPSGSLVWTYPQTYLGYVGFICSLMLSRRLGLGIAIAVPFTVWLVWRTDPANVVPEAFAVADGWLLVARMLGAQLLLWWSWWWLRDLAQRVDIQVDSLREAQVIAIANTERSQLWRQSADRVHATMLNSIGALLEARTIDASILRQLAREGREATTPAPPARKAPNLDIRVGPVNAGIVLITAALGGSLFAGWLYMATVPFPNALLWLLGVAMSLASSLAALYLVIRRRPIAWWQGVILVIIPGLIPWLLASFPVACGNIGSISAAASIAGFAIVCIGLWSKGVPMAIGLLIWIPGAIVISRSTPAECALAPTVIVLNVATFLPLVAVISLIGIRRHRKSLQRVETAEVASEVALAREEAIRFIDQEISETVRLAANRLDSIAYAGRITADDVLTLECLRSRMRAAVNIDVGTAHGFVKDAYELVVDLAKSGVPIEIGVLSGSDDPRPIAPKILTILRALARDAQGTPIKLQCIDSDAGDFLSLTCPLRAAESVGLAPGSQVQVEGTCLEVQEADFRSGGEAMVVVTVEREIAPDLVPAAH